MIRTQGTVCGGRGSYPVRVASTPGRLGRAFSLIEMMIAVVILGFGMIMAATMFPVGWTRARKLSEHTVRTAVAETGHATVSNLITPAGPSFEMADLAGDLIYAQSARNNGLRAAVRQLSDTRVHALHLQNIRIDPGGELELVNEDPWVLERVSDSWLNDPDTSPSPDVATYRSRSFFEPRLPFDARIYPALPDNLTMADNEWEDALNKRRYCWSVFYRFREVQGPDLLSQRDPLQSTNALDLLFASDAERHQALDAFESASRSERVLDVLYVTLRRPRSDLRYAMQDPTKLPDPFDRATWVAPAALEASSDVLFPTPWRVQVEFRDELFFEHPIVANGEDGPSSVPTVVTVDGQGDEQIVDLFPDGTILIDELTGSVFTVTERWVKDNTPAVARLTLDREVFVEELDDGFWDLGHFGNRAMDDEEKMRTVWLFPPPIQARKDSDSAVFSGKSPVIGVSYRTLSVAPVLE